MITHILHQHSKSLASIMQNKIIEVNKTTQLEVFCKFRDFVNYELNFVVKYPLDPHQRVPSGLIQASVFSIYWILQGHPQFFGDVV